MIVVLLGPPGAGKGTQAARLASSTGLTHLSTGELFRSHLRDGTELGRRAQSYMGRGELVPDDVVIGMVQERISEGDGFILDGFPRTVAQANALDELIGDQPMLVAVITVHPGELTRRLTGRRVCQEGGHVYNIVTSPPSHSGICDIDGSPLGMRDDDSESMVARRLEVYANETEPVLAFYAGLGRLRRIAGDGDANSVHAELLEELDTANQV